MDWRLAAFGLVFSHVPEAVYVLNTFQKTVRQTTRIEIQLAAARLRDPTRAAKRLRMHERRCKNCHILDVKCGGHRHSVRKRQRPRVSKLATMCPHRPVGREVRRMRSDATASGASSPRIRSARRDELEEVTRLQARAHAEIYAPPSIDLEAYVAAAVAKARRLRWIWRTYQVAEIHQRIVGSVQIVLRAVNALYVEREWRSIGIGSALLTAAEGTLRAKGVSRARLRVARDHAPAVAFYERRGWRLGQQTKDPTWGLPLVEMTKQFEEPILSRHGFPGRIFQALLGEGGADQMPSSTWKPATATRLRDSALEEVPASSPHS